MIFIDKLLIKIEKLHEKHDLAENLQEKINEPSCKNINKDKEIMQAVFNGNLNLKSLKLLFKHGLSSHTKDEFNNNLMNLYKDNLEIVKYLYKKGVEINSVNKYGESALFSLNKDVVKFLIAQGANINQINGQGENIIFAHAKDIEFVKYLISKGIKYDCVTIYGENICFRNKDLLLSLEESQVKKIFQYSGLNHQKRNIAFTFFYHTFTSDDAKRSISGMKKLEEYGINVNYSQIDLLGDNLYRYAHVPEMLDFLLDKNVPLTVINNNGDCMLDLIYKKDYMRNNNFELKEKILKVLAFREKEILDVIIGNESSNKIKNRL